MSDKKLPPKAVRSAAEALAKSLGVDPSMIEFIAVPPSLGDVAGGLEMDEARARTLDALFDLHRDDAIAAVDIAKGVDRRGACCNDCAVRAVASGQLEGAVRAFLSLADRDELFREAATIHSLVTEVLEEIALEGSLDGSEVAT